MFLKSLAMPRDQICGEKFDPKFTVELEKCAKCILKRKPSLDSLVIGGDQVGEGPDRQLAFTSK
jgi:hypothetical protein